MGERVQTQRGVGPGTGLTPPLPPHRLSVHTASCRICCRCGAEYLVAASGRCVRDEECYYHWGRLRRNRGEAWPLLPSASWAPGWAGPPPPPDPLKFLLVCQSS